MLELLHVSPDWRGALSVALLRPTGVSERRHGEDPSEPRRAERPRRLADDLAWLRVALADPEPNGLQPLPDGDVVVAWVPDKNCVERLRRLRDRAVLEAAGFRLFEADVFLVHCPETDRIYAVRVGDSGVFGTASLRVEARANNQLKGIRWAVDHELPA